MRSGRIPQAPSFTRLHLKGGWFMGVKRAKLLLAKARDDEVLIEEIISKERIRDEIIGFHAQQAAEKLLKSPTWHEISRIVKRTI
jgi:hypothetical protein